MKQKRCLLASHPIFLMFFLVVLLMSSHSVADEGAVVAVKAQKEAAQEFLHFGNMGGLLPTLTQSDMIDPNSPGAHGVFDFCSQCHNPPGPGMHTKEEWNNVFWRMVWRMQVMKAQFQQFRVPTYAQSHQMYSYLATNAMQAISASDVPANVTGGKEYLKICIQCHRLPSPAKHDAKDWPIIVKRMMGHIKNMGRVMPSKEESERIIEFLKSQEGQFSLNQ